jgi:hypothetical protein
MTDRWTAPAHSRQVVYDLAQRHMVKEHSLYAVVMIEPVKQKMLGMSIGTCNVLPTASEMVEGLRRLPPGSTLSVWRNEAMRERVLDEVLRRV